MDPRPTFKFQINEQVWGRPRVTENSSACKSGATEVAISLTTVFSIYRAIARVDALEYSSRVEQIRKNVLELSFRAKSAHVGSSLSCVEMVLACRLRFENGHQDQRKGRLILSKGHAAMALYATAMEFGELPKETPLNYLTDGSSLWGHPSVSDEIPFIHWSTGSLGHGLPVGVGFAYSGEKLSKETQETFVILSDGELNEGTNWEAFLFAGHHRLASLTTLIDYNKIQSFGRCEEILDLEPLQDKLRSFGWHVLEVDGHDLNALLQNLEVRSELKPKCIICHTIKGKGVPEFENTLSSHYKPVSEEIYRLFTQ